MSTATDFAAAAVAPFVVWVLWRIQTISVEVLRSRMVKLVRFTPWLYHTVSWFGTLLHEASHAVVLLLSGHGIRSASVKSEQGHVTPKRQRKDPFSFLSFLLAALAPLFLPPAIILVALFWFIAPEVVPLPLVAEGLSGAWETARFHVDDVAREILLAIAGLDLATPAGAAVFALVLLAAPGSRPSHVRRSYLHGGSEGDVAVVRRRIRKQPFYFLLFIAVVYGLYFVMAAWAPRAYWIFFQVVWSLAITAVVMAFVGSIWWTVAAWNTRIAPWLGWLAPLAFVAAQILVRGTGWPTAAVNVASLAAWTLAVAALLFAAPRRDKIDDAIST